MAYRPELDPFGKPTGGVLRDGEDGSVTLVSPDPENPFRQAFEAWLAQGNELPDPPPIAPIPRTALGSALRDALKASGQSAAWQDAVDKQSADTQAWWTTRYNEAVPITATKLVRIAKACSPPVDLGKLYDAAAL